MKKVFLAFTIMVSLVSFAQDKEGRGKFKPEDNLQARLKEMTSTLNLSDKQQNEVKLLLTEEFNKRQLMREDMKKAKESGAKISDERKAEMKKNRIDDQLEMKTKLKKILSEEQMKKWDEIQKEKRKEMHGKGPRGQKPLEKE